MRRSESADEALYREDPYEVRFERVRDLVIAIQAYDDENLEGAGDIYFHDVMASRAYAWTELLKELEISSGS